MVVNAGCSCALILQAMQEKPTQLRQAAHATSIQRTYAMCALGSWYTNCVEQ